MSIIISELSFRYPNQDLLLKSLNFSVEVQDKVAVVGSNGTGKSTLLKLLAGMLSPTIGTIFTDSPPCYIPQHTGILNKSVAESLGVKAKLDALTAITHGSINQFDYDALGDDWDIESRCEEAFAYWELPSIRLNGSVDDLSGGEKTKLFLSGLIIHRPDIVLLDEPTNHLDVSRREILYRYITESKATIVVVSHDITLLNKLQFTCELSRAGIKRYGGNYDFYREQKETEEEALSNKIHSEERALRLARKKAQEVRERQEKRLSRGTKNSGEVPRILKKTLTNSSENTASRLQGQHTEIIDEKQSLLAELRQQQNVLKEIRMSFDNSLIHPDKLLVEARQINYSYGQNSDNSSKNMTHSLHRREGLLWPEALDIKMYSRDRIHITGDNGCGKTTLIKLLTGVLSPHCGDIKRSDFKWIYLDQEYSRVDVNVTIADLAEQHNLHNLAEHEVKTRLNRFLFPSDTWDRCCCDLSGGEKMRLYLCCLNISSSVPDMVILDEPTNNLDISGLQILIQALSEYRGCLIVISHDSYFTKEIGVDAQYHIPKRE